VIARRRASLLVIPIAAGAVVLASAPGHTPARSKGLTISVASGLMPAYSPGVPDYTVRCGKPVAFRASVPAGQTVAVDGSAPASGEVRRDIALKPGQAFSFSVDSAVHNVRCVPADFPRWRVQGRGVGALEWLVFSPDERKVKPAGAPYSAIADGNGVPVWWIKARGAFPVNTRLLPDGTVTWARLGASFSQTYWDHVKLDGTGLPPFKAAGRVGADHHDLTALPNGNHLMIVYRPRRHVDLRPAGGPRDATVLDANVQELSPHGKLVWQWTSEGRVAVRESASTPITHAKVTYRGKPAYDLVHMNSVEYVGPDLVFSGKQVNAVYRVRRSSGKILWKLGGTQRRESLRFSRDPYGQELLGAQHDARVLPDGTVTVHDNGEFRRGRFPRIPRYRIDTRKRTATLIEDVRDKRVIQSYCCGSGTRIAGGRWLVAWGANPIITELSSAADGHKPIFTITLPEKLFSYRVQGVEPGVVTREALRAGMDAMFPRP
jgi:hypothetical protein